MQKQQGRRRMKNKRMAAFLAAWLIVGGMGAAEAAPETAASQVEQVGQVVGGQQRRDAETQAYHESEERLRQEQQKKENGIKYQELPVEPGEDTTTFHLNKIEFTASEILTKEELASLAATCEGHDVSMHDIRQLLLNINLKYKEKQYVTARAVLPPQKIHDGILQIRLVEGRYGRFIIEDNNVTRKGFVLSRIHLKENTLVRLTDIEKEVIFFNRTNSMQLQAELRAGEKQGETDCVLHVREPKPWTGTVYMDNAGSESSGQWRGGLLATSSNLCGGSENLMAGVNYTEGTRGGSLSYSQPIDTWGTRLGFSYGQNSVHITDGALSSMHIRGASQDFGVTLQRTLKATQNVKADSYLDVHHKCSYTDFFSNRLIDLSANTYTLGANLLYNAHGRTVWYTDLSATLIRASLQSDYTGKSFSRWNLSMLRQQAFRAGQMLTWRIASQYSPSRELPSTERFSLGGMSTVKGFEEGKIYGETGYYTGLEYSVPVWKKQNGRVLFDIDHGGVQQKFKNGSTQYDYLTSVSFGYSQNLGKNAFAKVYLSRPVSHSDSVQKVDDWRVHFYAQINF